MSVTAADLIVRVSNDEPHKFDANTFADLTELTDIIKFRVDHAMWTGLIEEDQVRVAVSAYHDINKLSWSPGYGRSQSRDYGFLELSGAADIGEPPISDQTFQRRVKRAQAAQAIYILAGTQVRDMAREGVKLTRALANSELEFTGYLGPACAEALEEIGMYLADPQLRRF